MIHSNLHVIKAVFWKLVQKTKQAAQNLLKCLACFELQFVVEKYDNGHQLDST
jgi:hypothetical protein